MHVYSPVCLSFCMTVNLYMCVLSDVFLFRLNYVGQLLSQYPDNIVTIGENLTIGDNMVNCTQYGEQCE